MTPRFQTALIQGCIMVPVAEIRKLREEKV